MIIENTQIIGIQSDLAYLDEVSSRLGFVRWQWEYKRATYDYKMENASGEVYYLRVNTRATEGKLESPHAILTIEAVYMGKAVFPHGMDYETPVPEDVLQHAIDKVKELYQALKSEDTVEDVMRKEIVRIEAQASLHEAAQTMRDNHTGMLAVERDGKLVGVVTERDLAVRGYGEKQTDAIPVEKVMDASFSSVNPENGVAQAIQLMAEKKVSGLLVLKDGAPVGIVTLVELAAKKHFG